MPYLAVAVTTPTVLAAPSSWTCSPPQGASAWGERWHLQPWELRGWCGQSEGRAAMPPTGLWQSPEVVVMGVDRHGCSARAPQCWQLLEQGPAQPPVQHGPGLVAGEMAACDQDPHAFPWTSQWHLGMGAQHRDAWAGRHVCLCNVPTSARGGGGWAGGDCQHQERGQRAPGWQRGQLLLQAAWTRPGARSSRTVVPEGWAGAEQVRGLWCPAPAGPGQRGSPIPAPVVGLPAQGCAEGCVSAGRWWTACPWWRWKT